MPTEAKQSDLTLFQGIIGMVHMRLHQHAESARAFQQACDRLRQVAAAHPGVPHYRVLLGMGLSFLQHELAELGSVRASAEADHQALELVQNLVAEFPEVPY
jgi:hypothetical protein